MDVEKTRCAVCGNHGVRHPIITQRNAGTRPLKELPWACERCAEVLEDRRRNMAFGPPLVRPGTTIWNGGDETFVDDYEMVRA